MLVLRAGKHFIRSSADGGMNPMPAPGLPTVGAPPSYQGRPAVGIQPQCVAVDTRLPTHAVLACRRLRGDVFDGGAAGAGPVGQGTSSSRQNWRGVFDQGRTGIAAEHSVHVMHCCGGKGTWYFISNVIAWACAGNNNGTFAWFPASGGTLTKNISPGWTWTFASGADAEYLTINSWSGSYNC
jgi:hypothetical protein